VVVRVEPGDRPGGAYDRCRVRAPDAPDTAFEQYVLPEIEVLFRVARSLTHQRAEAEDLVQDTLLRAYRSMEGFDGRHPRAWLLTILRNAHINRNRRRRPELLRDPEASGAAPSLSDTGPRPDAFVDEEIDVQILVALDALDTRFRQVLELIDVDGLSYAETAHALDIPVGTVTSRLHRARVQIRDRLDEAGLAPRGGQ
jgi:RNA polymerase sigma-70 factor, ECF subfamily